VLAARLSEDPDASVALLEAGPEDTGTEIRITAAFPSLFKSRWDWDFDSDPEPGLDGRRAYLPRGRMLGGSTSMNAMVYVRGNAADYDAWAADGAPGWGYDDVLPYSAARRTTSAAPISSTVRAARCASRTRGR
jgi:choline dehydrogenase